MKRLLLVALSLVTTFAIAQPLGAQEKPKSMTANGTVKSVSGDSLVVTSAGKDMTFTLDGTTKFVGKGLSTKSNAKGGKLTATDAVGAGDMVSVTYHDMAGKMHAANVRITNKATVKK